MTVTAQHRRLRAQRSVRAVRRVLVVALTGLLFALAPASLAPANAFEDDISYSGEWTGRGFQYNFDWYYTEEGEPFLCPSHGTWLGNFSVPELGKLHVTAIVPLCDPATEDQAIIQVSGPDGTLTAQFHQYWEGTVNGAVYSPMTGTGRFRNVEPDSTISIARELDFDWPLEPVRIWAKPGHGPIEMHLMFGG
jgi:hypothetical protein